MIILGRAKHLRAHLGILMGNDMPVACPREPAILLDFRIPRQDLGPWL